MNPTGKLLALAIQSMLIGAVSAAVASSSAFTLGELASNSGTLLIVMLLGAALALMTEVFAQWRRSVVSVFSLDASRVWLPTVVAVFAFIEAQGPDRVSAMLLATAFSLGALAGVAGHTVITRRVTAPD